MYQGGHLASRAFGDVEFVQEQAATIVGSDEGCIVGVNFSPYSKISTSH